MIRGKEEQGRAGGSGGGHRTAGDGGSDARETGECWCRRRRDVPKNNLPTPGALRWRDKAPPFIPLQDSATPRRRPQVLSLCLHALDSGSSFTQFSGYPIPPFHPLLLNFHSHITWFSFEFQGEDVHFVVIFEKKNASCRQKKNVT